MECAVLAHTLILRYLPPSLDTTSISIQNDGGLLRARPSMPDVLYNATLFFRHRSFLSLALPHLFSSTRYWNINQRISWLDAELQSITKRNLRVLNLLIS